MRENLLYQEGLLEQVMVVLQQHDSGQRLSPSGAAASNATWLPPEAGAAMTGRLPTIKLRKVDPHPCTPDIVTRLKGNWIGRLYLEHLKQIPLIRKIVITIWRNFYPVYARLVVARLSPVARRWRPIIKMADYLEVSNIPSIKVFDAAKVDTPTPKVVPAEDQIYLVSPHNYYEFPPIYVAQLNDAQVYGGTNLVFVQDAVICHDLYDFERDYTSEELHGRHVIDAKKKRMRLVRSDATPEHLPVAAAFLDACAPNYAHWLTEVLPRIAAFCSVEQHANVPIIIDDGLHPNIMESLALVVGNDREIIALPVGRAINVGILYVTSVTGYVPFERRNTRLVGHSHGVFSPAALELLRNKIDAVDNGAENQSWPEKIFLRRNSGLREVANVAELENLMTSRGYTIIEPEKLTFIQQVKLFKNAKKIVAPTGAALSNAIFCKPGTQVTVLMAKHKNMIYRYWCNMLTPIGINVSYILGNTFEKKNVGIHGDFMVDTEDVVHLLEAVERK